MALVTSLVVGFLIGVIVALSIGFPRVGRICARMIATVLFATGTGLLVWTIYAMATGDELRPIGWNQLNISEASEAFGWAGGLLAGGLFALVLSFVKAPSRRL